MEFGIKTIFKPYRIFSILTVIISVSIIVSSGKKAENMYIKKSNIPLILLVFLITVLSIIRIPLYDGSWSFFINDMMQTFYLFFVFLAMHSMKWNRKRIETILWILILALIINGFMMLNQFFFGFLGLSRATGYMDNPNSAGITYNTMLLFLYYQVTQPRTQLIKKLALIFIIFYFYLLIFTTGSRSGAGLIIIGLFYLYYLFSFKTKITGLITFFVILLLSIQPISKWVAANYKNYNLLVRISKFDGKKDERGLLWKGGLNAAKGSAFLGVGVAQFRYDFGRHFIGVEHGQYLAMRTHDGLGLHNDYMTFLVEGGILSLLLFLTFILWNIWKKFKRRRFKIPSLQLTILLFLLIYGMVGANFITPTYWFFLTIGSLKY